MKLGAKSLATFLEIPILEYTSVIERAKEDMRYCTTAEKFERDLRDLLENGYTPVSLSEYASFREGGGSCPEKTFAVVFSGGYDTNYSVAFPILKRLGVCASIFVATELIGVTSYPRMRDFTPHFGWEEAQEMIDSGLVHIYPMWHPFDEGKDFSEEAKNKLELLRSHLRDNGPQMAFQLRKESPDALNYLRSLGVHVCISHFLHTGVEQLSLGAAPTCEARYSLDALDMVDLYRVMAEDFYRNIAEEQQLCFCCSVPEAELSKRESIILPIDAKPRVRNYLRHAFALSVLQADRAEKADAILMREYIDLIYQPQRDWLDYDNDPYESWECFTCRRMSRDLLVENGINMITYLLNGMRIGYYADIWLDTYYIPGKAYYRKEHSTHGLLLYGYDAENRQFLSYSYNKREIYEQILVPVECLADACKTSLFHHVTLFKIHAGETIPYSFRDVCASLRDYLQSVPHIGYHRFAKNVAGQSVQYAAALHFTEKIEKQTIYTGKISQVAMYSYGEHKRLMMWRIQKLCKQNGIIFPELIEANSQTEKTTKWLVNATIKFNLTKSTALLDSIVRCMKEQNELERNILEKFLALAGEE